MQEMRTVFTFSAQQLHSREGKRRAARGCGELTGMQRGGGSAAEQELCFPTCSAWAVFPVSFLPPDTPNRLCWGDAGSGMLQLAVWVRRKI